MRVRRAVAAGCALAAIGAGAAQAATPELSVDQRLEDRREVAAGTRAQVLGFQDGRFYANGWHITGEMGGIITPPLKLLDSVSFRVNDTWVEPATEFTSGAGYVRYAFPSVDGMQLERTDVAPDGRRGALLGLKVTNPKKNGRTVNVFVDAHSELMTQYPWGFGGVVPNASDNVPDTGAFEDGTLVFRDTGELPGEGAPHSYTAIVGSDRTPRSGETGPGHYGEFGAGRVCAADSQAMPSECDDGPFGRGTGGQLHYQLRVGGGSSEWLWVAVAGSENSAGEAEDEFDALTEDPAGLLAAQRAKREKLAAWTQLDLPADRQLADSIEWGKQNLRDLTQVATDVDLRWTNEGAVWEPTGALDRMRWVGAGFPDYPWLFGVDGEYTAHASVTVGQFGPIKDHMRALRDISDQLSDRSGVVVHEVVADGSIWHGKNTRTPNAEGELVYDFNTDEIVKFPAAVALIWRWTGDDAFRDEMLDFMRRNLEYVRTELDEDADGWPEGNGNVERPGMGEEKLDNAVYYIRALYDFADMAGAAGNAAEAAAASATADALLARFEDEWWMESEGAVCRLARPGGREDQPEALDRREPDGGRAVDRRRGRARRRLVRARHLRARDPGEQLLQRRAARQPRPVPHGLQRRSRRRRRVRHLLARHRDHGRRRGQLRPAGRDAAAALHVGERGDAVLRARDGRHAGRAAGCDARDLPVGEVAAGGRPDATGTPPNIDRCWTCRSMFMQAWGHYGTSWSVVHQELGIRPSLGRGWLEVVPALAGWRAGRVGVNVRLGEGAADVSASRAGSRVHHRGRRDRRAGARDAPGRLHAAARRHGGVGHARRRGGRVERADHEPRGRGRGRGGPGEAHTVVVTAGLSRSRARGRGARSARPAPGRSARGGGSRGVVARAVVRGGRARRSWGGVDRAELAGAFCPLSGSKAPRRPVPSVRRCRSASAPRDRPSAHRERARRGRCAAGSQHAGRCTAPTSVARVDALPFLERVGRSVPRCSGGSDAGHLSDDAAPVSEPGLPARAPAQRSRPAVRERTYAATAPRSRTFEPRPARPARPAPREARGRRAGHRRAPRPAAAPATPARTRASPARPARRRRACRAAAWSACGRRRSR